MIAFRLEPRIIQYLKIAASIENKSASELLREITRSYLVIFHHKKQKEITDMNRHYSQMRMRVEEDGHHQTAFPLPEIF